jgi:thiol-disulfide isomerase/thioredoxin
VSRRGRSGTSGAAAESARPSSLRVATRRAVVLRRPRRRFATPLLALTLIAGAAGCTTEATTSAAPSPQETRSPFQDCTAVTGAVTPADLPDLKLPCFTGGQSVRLADVRGPAVINIWATWCDPCRAELPAMQRLADRTGGRLWVLGVDTGDSRNAAASFGTDQKVSLPTLYDPDRKLVGALGRTALPVTVFLDAAGKRFVYNQLPPDDAQLAALVRAHTGVPVTP